MRFSPHLRIAEQSLYVDIAAIAVHVSSLPGAIGLAQKQGQSQSSGMLRQTVAQK